MHEPITPSDFGLSEPGLYVSGAQVYPDCFTLEDAEPIRDLFGLVENILQFPARPPLGLLVMVASLSRSLTPSGTFVLVGKGADDPLAELLVQLGRDRIVTRVVLREPDDRAQLPIQVSDPHNVLFVTPRFTFADVKPQRASLFYLADIHLRDAHWNWFHAERLIETIDSSLLPGGVMIVACSDRGNIQKGIIENFVPLRDGRYEVVYQGQFGSVQARPALVLRKLRDLDQSVRMACCEASSNLFGGPVTLSHEMDRRFTTRSVSDMQFAADRDRMVSYVVTPARTVTLKELGDGRFRDRFPDYYISSYRTPEIRLNRLLDGIVFSRLPTCIASFDGTVFLTSYGLAEFVSRSRIPVTDHRCIAMQREKGEPFLSGFATTCAVLPDAIPEVTNCIEFPVFYFGVRWIGMYGHFLHEACPQIGIWQKHLRPFGIKLLVHPLSKSWQWDALRSIGVVDDDMVPCPVNSTLMCRELWFSNSFEDSRYNVLPEITYFADRTTLSDSTRPRTLKVYAARIDTRNRLLLNEMELIDRLKVEGFVIFVGSEHSLAEQVAIFEQADVIVGKDGTNLSNIIFCNRNTILVEILGESFFDPLYMRFANARGMHYDHVLANTVRGAGRDAESIVDVEAVVAAVKRAMQRRLEGKVGFAE